MAGWHHWLDGRESEWTPGVGDGQGGLACCDSWGCKEFDTTEQLNWTELCYLGQGPWLCYLRSSRSLLVVKLGLRSLALCKFNLYTLEVRKGSLLTHLDSSCMSPYWFYDHRKCWESQNMVNIGTCFISIKDNKNFIRLLIRKKQEYIGFCYY